MILNTFYLLYKSNAEDVIKGNKAVEKSTKETEKSLKNTNEEAQKLGQSFVKTMENLATLGGAAAGFQLLKSGISNATEYNAALVTTSKLYDINAQKLKTFAQAAAASGGTKEGFIANIRAIYANAQAQGITPPSDIGAFMGAVRNDLKNYQTNAQRQARLNQLGFTDEGARMMLSQMSDIEYATKVADALDRTKFDEESQKKATEFVNTMANLSGSVNNFWTSLANNVIHPVDYITGLLDKGIRGISGNDVATLGAGAVVGASPLLGLKGLAKLIGKRAAGAAAITESTTGTGVAGFAAGATSGALVGGATLGIGTAAGYYGLGYFSDAIEKKLAKMMLISSGENPYFVDMNYKKTLAGSIASGNSDIDFWMSKGYSHEQAAGIVANMMHESGGKATAIGDGGLARGLFQWHPDRQAAIKKATGIDVTTASHEQQLEAAAWEMKNGRPQFSDEFFRSLKSPDEAASYFSRMFESPAGGINEAIRRGQSALNIASQYPMMGNSTNNTIKIDKIEVNTQATDANGVAASIEQALTQQINYLAANSDDGEYK